MQIAPASAVPPVSKIDKAELSPIQAALAALKARKEEAAAKPFEPAPALRPNIQDYVDINRTLLMLRTSGG